MTISEKSDSPTPNTEINLGTVAPHLGVGWRVAGRLPKEGKIKTTRDSFDHRRKLVSTKDLDLLKQTSLKGG